MAFTLNTSGTNSNGGSSTTIAVTPAGTVVAGNLVVVGCGDDSSNTMTVSDGTTALTALTLNSTGAVRWQLFYLLSSVASGSVTYTGTFGASSTAREIQVYVFTLSAAATFDTEIATASNIGTAITTGNITTTGTDELVIGSVFNENAFAVSAQAINGTGATGSIGGGLSSVWYLALASTFTGQGTATLAGSSRWAANMAAFKIAGGGGGVTFPQLERGISRGVNRGVGTGIARSFVRRDRIFVPAWAMAA